MYAKRKISSRQRLRSRKRDATNPPYLPRGSLLTPGENRFYQDGLKPALGDLYLISFKVRLADVITVDDWEGIHGRRIAQKHLDFVLITPSTRIVAAVELNDSSHRATERQQRDTFVTEALRTAGIPLIAFPIYGQYDQQKIRNRILAAVNSFRRLRPRWRRRDRGPEC